MVRTSFFFVSCAFAGTSAAFAFGPPQVSLARKIDSKLHIFGGLGDAFKNDDSLGERKNDGLSGGPKYNEQVTINGKPIKVVVGQAVKVAANSARVKIPYNCQQGDCGTCMIKMNGRKVKACQSKIPSGKCTIQTL
mmetsp:Transcript_28600/g.42282  ORF Transcript_28600/g.42282 Transcript_28600/m.42282 type:complete len:136 (-) Transcript_28600:2495-2902(-)